MTYVHDNGVHVVFVPSVGFFRSPPACWLAVTSITLLAVAAFVVVCGAIGCFRGTQWTVLSILGGVGAFLVALLVALIFSWLGWTFLKLALLSAWGQVLLRITPQAVCIERQHPWRSKVELRREKYRDAVVGDYVHPSVAWALTVYDQRHRGIDIACGRSVEELGWLADLLEDNLAEKDADEDRPNAEDEDG